MEILTSVVLNILTDNTLLIPTLLSLINKGTNNVGLLFAAVGFNVLRYFGNFSVCTGDGRSGTPVVCYNTVIVLLTICLFFSGHVRLGGHIYDLLFFVFVVYDFYFARLSIV